MQARSWFKRFPLAAGLLMAFSLGAAYPAHAYDQELKSVALRLSSKLASAKKTSIAVVDLVNLEGNTTWLGRFLAEEIANDLGNTERGFEIIDRTHTRSIMKEHKLSANGFIDKLTTTQLGSMTGAQALVLGTITPFGDSLRVQVKVLDTKTSKQIAAESTEFAKTKALAEMYAKALPDEEGQPAAKTATKKESSAKAAKQEDSETADDDSDSENVAELRGIKLQLSRCDKGGQSVSCHLVVESPSRDVQLDIHEGTRIFDESGAEFSVSQGKIANSEARGHCWGLVGKTLIAGVKTPVLLVFQNVGTKPKKLTAFELALSIDDCRASNAHFRNITLTKAGSGKTAAAGGDDSEAGGGLLDEALGTAKDEMRSLIKGGFSKLRKKAKVPDPAPNGQ